MRFQYYQYILMSNLQNRVDLAKVTRFLVVSQLMWSESETSQTTEYRQLINNTLILSESRSDTYVYIYIIAKNNSK